MPSSRNCFAVPNIVWTTSVVEISRETPRRIPASIIASASSAKYAGPEPEIAVTASINVSGTRTTRPRWPEQFLRDREVLLARVRACADPGHAFVDGRGRVRHRAHDGDTVGDPLLDMRGRDRGGDGNDGLLRREARADLREEAVDVLRLDGDDDDRGAVGGRDVVVAAPRDDDLRLVAPAGADEAGVQRFADPAPAEDCDRPFHG